MPTYEYLCQECGERLEVFQKFTDKTLTVHPDCGGPLQKIFHASGVVFKGSGYYVTDSRPNGKSSAAAKSDSGSSGDSTKSDNKSDAKSDKSNTKSEKSDKATTSDKSSSSSTSD